MNKSLKTVLLIILLVTLISTISYCSAPFDTETAHSITVRQSVTGSGFILRTETPVANSTNGVFESSVKDGERVFKGSSVGVIISGNLNESLAAELAEVTKRIEEIKEADSISDIYSSDEARVFSAMKDLAGLIRDNAYNNDYAAAAESAMSLNSVLQKKHTTEGKSSADRLLISLEEQKYNLEQQLGGIREVVLSPASGYFYTTLDGLENFGKEEKLASLMPVDINEFSNLMENHKKGNAVAKITDTYVWYLAASIPAEEVSELKAGSQVRISIDESSFVDASVLAVNIDDTGEASVIIKSSKNIVGIFEKRTAEFEICINEYTGLYVPAAAIRVLDGVTGVYTIKSNKSVDFKCVDILYQSEDYYIVKGNYTPPETINFQPLKLYDDILVNPEATHID